jgi:DNA-binding MarR family transcriptional regulator
MKLSPISTSEVAGTADDCKKQAQELRRTIDELCHNLERVNPPAINCFVDAPTEREVRKVIRARRARERFFDASLFGEPAWDILLELFASGLSNQRVPVTRLCNAASVPASTALRWITNLEDCGMIKRHDDPLDRRRSFLSLSLEANLAMASLFKSIAPAAVI